MTEYLQKIKAETKKNMWVYEGCFDIISRNEIQVKFMDSYMYLSSEKDLKLVPRLLRFNTKRLMLNYHSSN